MTVGELRAALANFPDNLPVITEHYSDYGEINAADAWEAFFHQDYWYTTDYTKGKRQKRPVVYLGIQ